MSKSLTKIPVAERALVGRINRALAKKATPEQLLRCREDSRWFNELGRYYVTNANRHLRDSNVDIEKLGRELGVLMPGEALAE